MDEKAEENLNSTLGKGSYAYSCTSREVGGEVDNGRGNWYTVASTRIYAQWLKLWVCEKSGANRK